MQYSTKAETQQALPPPTPLEKEHSNTALAQRIATSLHLGGLTARAKRMRQCGMEVRSLTCSRDPAHYHAVAVPRRCRNRLCPSCASAASRVAGAQMADVTRRLDADKEGAWILLNLTMPNAPAHRLKDAVGDMLDAWTKLRKHAGFKAGITGWARRLEFTYNPERKDFHHHVHALLHVKPSYWKKHYISQPRWVSMWATALGVDYDPIVHVSRIKGEKGALEATGKYAVKPISLSQIADMPHAVCAVSSALHRRRLLDYGGDVAKMRKVLLQPDPEAVDDPRPEICPTCGSPIVEAIMHWSEDAYTRFATLDKHL